MTQNISYNYAQAIKSIKQAILKSRYQAAMLANREMLMLYFSIGDYISKNSRKGSWGKNAIDVISLQLQKELPGLRGFSTTNLKNMRLFFEAWQHAIPDSQNQRLLTDDLQYSDNEVYTDEIIIRQLSTDELSTNQLLNCFVSIGFTHHIMIINTVKDIKERLFYIENCAQGIILCKEKSNKIVEFAFKDTSKPMGVATYRTARELPPEYKGFLPDVEKLKELMDG